MSITKCLEELRTHPDNIPNEDFKQPHSVCLMSIKINVVFKLTGIIT
jgi:hypothetical protein